MERETGIEPATNSLEGLRGVKYLYINTLAPVPHALTLSLERVNSNDNGRVHSRTDLSQRCFLTNRGVVQVLVSSVRRSHGNEADNPRQDCRDQEPRNIKHHNQQLPPLRQRLLDVAAQRARAGSPTDSKAEGRTEGAGYAWERWDSQDRQVSSTCW